MQSDNAPELYNLSAEQAVIGAILTNPESLHLVCGLEAADFHDGRHRAVYQTYLRLAAANERIDVITVADRLAADGYNGISPFYVGELAINHPSSANIAAYAKIIADRAVERRLLTAAADIVAIVHDTGETTAKIDRAQSAVMSITVDGDGEAMTARDLIPELVRIIEDRDSNPGLRGLATGFADIDRRLNGLKASDLIIVAARPSVGKTSFAMNLVEHAAMSGHPALVFSMEMSRVQLMERLLSSVSGVEFERVQSGKYLASDWDRLSEALHKIKDAPIVIDDTSGLTINALKSRARKLYKKHKIELIVVDYLQLMSGSGESREREISEISRGLKGLAKELTIPVVALSQLNRSLEARQDKRPVMSDLRDSGSIEQDADIILFLYRDELHNPESPRTGITEVITRKFRNGCIGTDYLSSRLHISRFGDFAGQLPEYTPTAQHRRRGGYEYD